MATRHSQLNVLDDGLGALKLTPHARLRSAQRNLPEAAIAYVMAHGLLVQKTGVAWYVLRRRDIPIEDRAISSFAQLEGAVVLVSSDAAVITCERNRKAMRAIRQKKKRRSVGVIPIIDLTVVETIGDSSPLSDRLARDGFEEAA